MTEREQNNFSAFINESIEIKSSDRWDNLNSKVEKYDAIVSASEKWRSEVFSGLVYRTLFEYNRLKEAYEGNGEELSIVAWHSRNLLELKVWAESCVKNDEWARRIFEDAGRDHHDLLTKLGEWGKKTELDEKWVRATEVAKNTLIENAAKQKVDELERKNYSVAKAAMDIGISDYFKIQNKLFSKFAHPTAGYIVFPPLDEHAAKMKFALYGSGCLLFVQTFKALEKIMESQSDG